MFGSLILALGGDVCGTYSQELTSGVTPAFLLMNGIGTNRDEFIKHIFIFLNPMPLRTALINWTTIHIVGFGNRHQTKQRLYMETCID